MIKLCDKFNVANIKQLFFLIEIIVFFLYFAVDYTKQVIIIMRLYIWLTE